jgi:hypothetical protein
MLSVVIFTIVEFKGNFRIQKKHLIDKWFYFIGIALWIKGQKETWNYIIKKQLNFSQRKMERNKKTSI